MKGWACGTWVRVYLGDVLGLVADVDGLRNPRVPDATGLLRQYRLLLQGLLQPRHLPGLPVDQDHVGWCQGLHKLAGLREVGVR